MYEYYNQYRKRPQLNKKFRHYDNFLVGVGGFVVLSTLTAAGFIGYIIYKLFIRYILPVL